MPTSGGIEPPAPHGEIANLVLWVAFDPAVSLANFAAIAVYCATEG